MSSIHGADVCRRTTVHHVIQRVQAKRCVIWNPEHAVAAAQNRFGIDAVGEANAWREFTLFERQIVSVMGVRQKYVSIDWRRTRREKLRQVVGRGRVKVRQAVESF